MLMVILLLGQASAKEGGAAPPKPDTLGKFTSAEGRFSVYLPGKPRESVGHPSDIHTFITTDQFQTWVMVVQYSGPREPSKQEGDAQSIRQRLLVSRDMALKLSKGWRLLESRWVTLGRHHGLAFDVDGSGDPRGFDKIFSRIYICNNL